MKSSTIRPGNRCCISSCSFLRAQGPEQSDVFTNLSLGQITLLIGYTCRISNLPGPLPAQ